jgi:hypothetical protein
MQLMKPKATLRRATRLVKDGTTITLWLVDASMSRLIHCRKWHFESVGLAEAAEREIVDAIATEVSTDVLINALTMLTDGEVTICDSEVDAVGFFSGKENVAMRREAHALLSALVPA